MTIRVYPVDWYSHFSLRSPVCALLSSSLNAQIELVTNLNTADIVLVGAYGVRHQQSHIAGTTEAWKLFITGENHIPDLRYYDHSLSFCRFDFDGRNFRWPIWFQSLSMDGIDSGTFTPDETQVILNTNRPLYMPDSRPQWNEVVAVFNNCEPVRCHVFERLQHFGIIKGIGTPFGNALPWGDENTYRPKIDVLRNFGFNLCFENTISDGYYTEKVLHARVCGCVPLVYADPHMSHDFNLDSCINLYGFESINEFCDLIYEVSSSHSKWVDLASGPIFSRIPDLEPVRNFLRSSYESFHSGSFVRNRSSFDHMRNIVQPPTIPARLLKKLQSWL